MTHINSYELRTEAFDCSPPKAQERRHQRTDSWIWTLTRRQAEKLAQVSTEHQVRNPEFYVAARSGQNERKGSSLVTPAASDTVNALVVTKALDF